MANYMKIKNWDTANGEGLGVSIFFSGCDKVPKCKGCFNKESWDCNAGKPFNSETIVELLELVGNPHISHLAILGGEPLADYNLKEVSFLCRQIKETYPNKKIWLWSHYTWEEIIEDSYTSCLILPYIDVLVDGEYIEEQRDLTLKWRGSKNQRVIDVKKSLGERNPISYCN